MRGKTWGVAAALSSVGGLAIAQSVPPEVAPVVAPEVAMRAPAASAVPAAGEAGYFKGTVSLPGAALDFSVRLVMDEDGEWAGTIDIPMQRVTGYGLQDIDWTGERLAFVMALPGPEAGWPRFSYELEAGESEARGRLRQSGMEFPSTVERTAGAPEGPARPQAPVGPFPYESREVEIENAVQGVTLAGTLVVPEGDGPFPCAIFITGSGMQDRDETLFGHKPFLVLADHLARQGIASLRCDDRGVGGSTEGDVAEPDSVDLATDTAAMVEWVVGQEGIDPARVGLIGHSEGGLIGPMVAAEDGRVSFLVMLAGPGVPGDEILARQMEAMARAGGAEEAALAQQRPMREQMLAALKAGDAETGRAALVELLKAAMPAGGDEVEAVIESMADEQMKMLASRWMRTFMELDPRVALREVDCPVLVLNGDLDMQVLHDQNVPEVEKALREGGNRDVTVQVLKGLNHMFQPATTGSMVEYQQIETTFDEGAMEVVSGWILGVGR